MCVCVRVFVCVFVDDINLNEVCSQDQVVASVTVFLCIV